MVSSETWQLHQHRQRQIIGPLSYTKSRFSKNLFVFLANTHAQRKGDTNDQFVEKHTISMDLQHHECYLGDILQQLYRPNQNIWVILEPLKRVEAKTRDLLVTSLTLAKKHKALIWIRYGPPAGERLDFHLHRHVTVLMWLKVKAMCPIWWQKLFHKWFHITMLKTYT